MLFCLGFCCAPKISLHLQFGCNPLSDSVNLEFQGQVCVVFTMKFSRRNDIGDEDDGELASVEYVDGSLRARITPASRKRRLVEQQSIATEKEAFPVGKKKAEEEEQRAKQEEEIPLSEKRRALFEPLVASATSIHGHGGRSVPAESLLPPPDFDSATYPRGWVVGKRRKLVNVDVVESMRRVAILEMNRKDLEINGLNEQLEEDARCIEHLQQQLLQERSKRAEAEREKSALQDHVNILMDMLHSNEEECVEESVDVA